MANNRNLFGFTPILPHLIIIAAAVGGYFLIRQYNLFYDWQTFIYYGVKALIALEIILASARSFLAPILGAVAAGIILFLPDITGQPIAEFTSNYLTSADGWQLLVVSLIGLLITAMMKLK